MKANVCINYEPPDVLQLKDVAKPAPKENEVLIRIYSSPFHELQATATKQKV